jgi:hypothetical protein
MSIWEMWGETVIKNFEIFAYGLNGLILYLLVEYFVSIRFFDEIWGKI